MAKLLALQYLNLDETGIKEVSKLLAAASRRFEEAAASRRFEEEKWAGRNA